MPVNTKPTSADVELMYLHVRMSNIPAQVDQGRSRKHVEALHLRIKEYRDELALAKKDAKRAAKALKLAEVSLMPWSIRCCSQIQGWIYPAHMSYCHSCWLIRAVACTSLI